MFQAELRGRNFPTELVPDHMLPVLHPSFQIQRIECREEVLLLTDSLGHQRARSLDDLVFLAAGFVNRLKIKTEWNQHIDFNPDGRGLPRMVTEREVHEENELEFRLDFFFCSEPNRLHAPLAKETTISHQGKPLRLRDRVGLRGFLDAMAKLLPEERMNTFLRDPGRSHVYPSLACYENEIRWHFHRLMPGV